jgi:hypothetical protein
VPATDVRNHVAPRSHSVHNLRVSGPMFLPNRCLIPARQSDERDLSSSNNPKFLRRTSGRAQTGRVNKQTGHGGERKRPFDHSRAGLRGAASRPPLPELFEACSPSRNCCRNLSGIGILIAVPAPPALKPSRTPGNCCMAGADRDPLSVVASAREVKHRRKCSRPAYSARIS